MKQFYAVGSKVEKDSYWRDSRFLFSIFFSSRERFFFFISIWTYPFAVTAERLL